MSIERHELRCFHAVIEAGGFSRAAQRLDLSQSAVSQTVSNLEHRLGASLLHRGSPPRPTEAGMRLLRYAESMLHEERETLADIQRIKAGALSTLSLSLSPYGYTPGSDGANHAVTLPPDPGRPRVIFARRHARPRARLLRGRTCPGPPRRRAFDQVTETSAGPRG